MSDDKPDETGWIPVTDRLPEPHPNGDYGSWHESGPVLVVDKDGYMCTAYYQHWAPPDEEMSVWKECGRDAYTFEGVTYWRPLPEPPEAT